MHNGQRRETVKGARLNLIINFYDYSGARAAALERTYAHSLRAQMNGAHNEKSNGKKVY